MNPLLLVGAGGAAAYLLLRSRDAFAATPAAAAAPQDAAASPIVPPVPTVPSVPAVTTIAALPLTPTQTAPISPPIVPPRITMPAPVVTGEVVARPASVVQLNGRWGWPVPRWQGRAPVISDGFGSPRGARRHDGVDIMFARIASDPFPRTGPNGSKLFVMPDAWPAVAAGDGLLWSAGHTPRGYAVVIDHGTVATFYQHLDTLMIPETKPPAKGTPKSQRIPIKAGQPLGVIGGDPLNAPHLKHLHFEVWAGGPQSAFDPQSLMRSWQVFTPSDVTRFIPAVTRNAAKPARRSDLVSVVAHSRAYPGERMQR